MITLVNNNAVLTAIFLISDTFYTKKKVIIMPSQGYDVNKYNARNVKKAKCEK